MYTFLRFPEFRRKAVTLNYDDNVREDKPLIEIMNKNGLKGTFNMNSERFGKSPEERKSKEEVLELFADSSQRRRLKFRYRAGAFELVEEMLR